jgi:hypothetical protein
MKRGSTMSLRLAVWLLGLIVLGLCVIALPVGIRSQTITAYHPFLLGMYLPALPFFVALYQTLKLLDYIDNNTVFSEASVTALKTVKYCGYSISVLYALGLPYLLHVADSNDALGVVVLALLVIGTSFVVATSAAVLQKLLANVIDIKSENDLTV